MTDAVVFESLGNNYRAWRRSALALITANNVLWRERDKVETKLRAQGGTKRAPYEILTRWVELMLVGFALEALFKSLWVKRGGKFVVNGMFRQMPGGRRHNLVSMAKELRFKLSSDERVLLSRISRIARAFGRYPIRTQVNESRDCLAWSTPTDDAIAERVYERLAALVRG